VSTDTYYGIDPVFNDDTDFINCDTCKRLFDYKEYKSLTCSACESGEYEAKEGESMFNYKEKATILYALEEHAKVLELEGNIESRNRVLELTWKVSNSMIGESE